MQHNQGQNQKQGEHIVGIVCDVNNCVYNNQKRECTANQVKVGPQYANSTDDTLCATFKS